jgi:hypothetical protein
VAQCALFASCHAAVEQVEHKLPGTLKSGERTTLGLLLEQCAKALES